jgi:histidinol-phosphate aminotransferase
MNRLIKKRIKELDRTDNTFMDKSNYLRLDKNERIFDFDKDTFDEFVGLIKSYHLSSYPSIESTYEKLSNYLGVERKQVLLSAGSDIAIKSIYEACISENDKIVLPYFCYAMYNVYGKMFGANVTSVKSDIDWEFDIDKMLGEVDKNTKMFVLENPSGTFGSKLSFRIIEKCSKFLRDKGVLFLVDEAYSKDNRIDLNINNLMKECPNFVISRSFSKFSGLAGLRVGFLVGSECLIKDISKVRPMHEITSISSLAVEWVLDHPELIDKYNDVLDSSKKYLQDQFLNLGIRYRSSEANFVFAYLPYKDISAEIEKCGIILKPPFSKEYLDGWTRITVGTLEDSKRLVREIKNYIEMRQ